MAKVEPQVLIFGDSSWPVASLAKSLDETGLHGVSRYWIAENSQGVEAALDEKFKTNGIDNDSQPTLAIVGYRSREFSKAVVQKLRARKQDIKILEIGSGFRGDSKTEVARPSQRLVGWQELCKDTVELEIQLLEIQKQVTELKKVVGECQKVALLLQDDPDPDGLAAALGLRKVIGRNSQSAPIVSFGRVTRPENVAMARLLEISVEQIHSIEDLGSFDRVIMVDCQPSFFKGRDILPDAIVDHHPPAELSEVARQKLQFVQIHEDLGSTSTLTTQYLRALKIEISQRLATALVYGIKSDTLALNRQVSAADLEAFTFLYPLMNGNMLRKIERPELPLGFVEVLRKALRKIKVEKGIVILSLGQVDREEWIPQAADFGLQLEGSEWSLASGIFEGRVVTSLRNCGYIQHGGDVFKEIFGDLGAAGGHRCMAKAIVAKSDWEKKFGKNSLKPASIRKILLRTLTKRIQERTAENSKNL